MNRIIKIIVLSVVGFSCLVVPIHFWFYDRHAFMRSIFPAQAFLSAHTVSCSDSAPDWLRDMSAQGISGLKALSTQVALIDATGRLSHCESGWESTMLLSKRVGRDTQFRYGSMTKSVTAAKILGLVREQKLSLDDTLGGLFLASEGEKGVASVTVSQLLRHRSGVAGQMFTRKSKPACPYDLVEMISSGTVKDQGNLRYSNTGYCILGEIISKVTGSPYRESMDLSYKLSERGIGYVRYEETSDEVERDFRFNDFYGRNLKGRFDYNAISSTAGMKGSASAYAQLMRDLISETSPGLFESGGCDSYGPKECYGNAFYEYRLDNNRAYYVKEGYLPGSSGVVLVNEKHEILVWLGNSDTENAASGSNMKEFIGELSGQGF